MKTTPPGWCSCREGDERGPLRAASASPSTGRPSRAGLVPSVAAALALRSRPGAASLLPCANCKAELTGGPSGEPAKEETAV